jgi:hypothetical protein
MNTSGDDGVAFCAFWSVGLMGVFQGVGDKSKQDVNSLVSCCFEGGRRLLRLMAGVETAL